MSPRLPSLIPLILLALVVAPPASALPEASGSAYQQLAAQGIQRRQSKASSAAEAAAIAKQRYGGKVLKVEAINTGDGVRYRVKLLLNDGRVKTVII